MTICAPPNMYNVSMDSPTSDQTHVSGLTETQSVNWITTQQACELFSTEHMPRIERTVRRYCFRGDLECRKTENTLHQPQYFISKASVETYISQQKTLMSTQLDVSGQVRVDPEGTGREILDLAQVSDADLSGQNLKTTQTAPGMPGQVRREPDRGASNELVEQLRERLVQKDEEISFLRDELRHRRTTDGALHDVIAAFRANAEAQRLAAAPKPEGQGTSGQHPSQF